MDFDDFSDFFRETKNFILVLIIIILAGGLAAELIYIQKVLTPQSIDEQCVTLCSESGRVAYIYGKSCYCKYPINFEKNVHCFTNVSFETSDVYNKKFNVTAVRNIAVSSVVGYENPNSIATRIFSIYNLLSNRIVYVSDPLKDEYVASPIETWDIRGGDCDDMALLLASLYESIGLDVEIVEVYNDTYGHAFIIVRIDQDLNTFLEEYKKLLEKYTPYSGNLKINIVLFENTENQCQVVKEGIKMGNSVNTFYIIIDSTVKNYAGGYDPINNFKRIKFLRIG